jgi:RNA polymerase sigma factor FliA
MAKHRTGSHGPREGEQEIFEKYKDWVKRIGLSFRTKLSPGLDWDDIIQEGYIGLLDAIRNFDESRGVPFSRYAKKRIIGSLIDCIRENTTGPRSIAKFWEQRKKTVSSFLDKHSRFPNQVEIADLMGLKLEIYHRLDVLSLEIYAGVSIEVCESFEFNTEWRVTKDEKRQVVKLALLSLEPRQIQILYLHHIQGLTMVEVGQILGVSESRVSQLRSQALKKIHRILSKLGYEPKTSL